MFGVYGSSECSRKDASSIEGDIGGFQRRTPHRHQYRRAIPYPEETDPMYRWFAFPVDAPPRGASRPSRVIHERYLPYDPDGRRGREGYRLVRPLASMPPYDMPNVFDDEEPPYRAKSTAPTSDDDVPRARRAPPQVTEVTLPTEAALEEGYVYGRGLQVVSADYTSSSAHWSTYKPTDFECAKCIRCIQTSVFGRT